MKEVIANLLAKELKLKQEEIINLIEIPPSSELGDYSFPCFSLSGILKKNPAEIARELSIKIKPAEEIEKIQSAGPYLNFFIDKNFLAHQVLSINENFGKSSEGKRKTIVIDMSSPNIAKPFGIGHLRSTIIGNSIARMFEFMGFKAIKLNYLGDWGTQFGRVILGYKKWGSPSKLKSNPAKHILELYVKASQEQYEQEARDEFRKLEQGDKENLKLWKMFRDLSLKEFNRIYTFLGIKFEVTSGESLYNNKMDSTLIKLKEKGLLEESEGALIVNLEKYGLGVCLIKKSDGTTLYATRDITAAIDRYKKFKFSKMIYEVGQEQKLHFKQVFKVLELLGYKFAENCIHVSHGLYLDKDGKKFATRKGKTISMEEIITETITLAKKSIMKKNPSLRNKEETARKVAIAAIFYGDLKNSRINDIVFDIERFLDFEGDTGPYLQYSYARASSILKKAGKKKKEKISRIPDLDKQEFELIKLLLRFPEVIQHSAKELSPHIIANYSFQLAQKFNEFYHSSPVIGSEKELFRMYLVDKFRKVMKSSLYLLGIDVLEQM